MHEILIVHRHRLLREGLRSLLDQQSDMTVIAEAQDGHGGVNLARKLRPTFVLMEVMLAGLNGIDATRQILAEVPNAKILALSKGGEDRLAAQMVRAGAFGYLEEGNSFVDLMLAIESAGKGEVYLNSVAGVSVRDATVTDRSSGGIGNGGAVLTPREREVLELLADGMRTKEIAGQLIVSAKTIETHRKHIMDKLDMRSVAELTKYAIREGMTSV